MRGKGEGSIYKDSRGFWTAVVELPPGPGGKRRRKVVRRTKKSELLDALDELRSTVKKRGDVATADQTLETWLTYWLAEILPRDAKPKTAAGYRSVTTRHIMPTIGYVRLEKLTPDHVRQMTREMEKKGLSSTYALNAQNVLSSALEVAHREGRVERNVATMVTPPKRSTTSIDAFTLDEALLVLEHVLRDPVMGARWATSLLTGMRRGEVLGLERDRLGSFIDLSWQLQRLTSKEMLVLPGDFERRHLTGGLYLTPPKSNAGTRAIPMFEPLRTILDVHMARSENRYGLVFARADGQPIDPDQDTRAWREVLADTGIDRDVPLHGLRHTTVDLLYLAGVPEDLISQIIGHSVRSVTRAYKSKANLARLESAMEMFGALFISSLAGTPDRRPALDA